MRRAKRITALAVAAAMVLSNVAYAAPDTNTTTTQQGAESLNSQSDASGGVKDQASDTKGNTSTSASQSKEQVKQNESSQSTDPGDQKQTDSKEDVVSQNQDQKKDEDSKETQKPSTEADSQKSETQNVDADKSEDTQEPSKEQEKVLYDITFDTPEKHGRVTDLDGKEVADGKTLKTDENGKAKFKVKPDAGYQVQAVYQMPDEQTPLKLVKDSYYEMQVEKNTTVKVVYQKIPAKNDSEDAGEDDSQKAEDVKGEADTSESKGNEQNVDQQKNETEKATSNAKEDFSQNDVKEEKSPIANWFSAAPSNEVSPYSIEDNTATGEIYYEVRFVDENEGLIWEPQYVLDGTFTTAPILSWENVTESGKHFVGWKSSLDEEIYTSAEICEREVKQDITYKAVFKTNQKYEVRIEYVYVDQSGKTIGQADQPYVAEVDFGESYQNVVNSPKIPGFTPDKTEVNINLSEGQEQDYVETVKYTGAPKEYTVIHQLQNLDDDGYTDQYKETLQGTIGLKTNAVAKDYDGFTAQPIENVTLQNDGETIIYVKYTRNSYVLTYNSHGGTYVGPVTLKYGAKISYPGYDTMKRVGYEFAGWKEEVQYPTMPAQDLTVNALWNDAKTASYTVVYWLENFTGKNGLDGYDYITAKTKTGQVGDMTSYEKLTRSEWEDANIDPDGVELNSQTQNIKIKADGSTVVNVLYNRKTFTIKFNEYKRVGGVIIPQYEWVENQELRITAKYGEDISEEWQKACENDGWGPEKSGDTQYTLFANMPAENLEMYQKESGTGTTISYYVEGLNGQRKLYSKFQASNGVYLTDEDKQPIEGFQFEDWKKETMGWWDNELWLYYTRNSYSISFENASGMNDKNVKYEATLSSAKPMDNMVKPPEGIDSDSTFGGWYYSPACESGTEVKWNSDTMPAHNVRVYAKWIPAQYTLSFETNGAGNIEPKVLDKYDVIEVPEQNPTKDGYTFLGWFLDENFTKPFTEGFQILEDTTLYAKWVKENETYRYTVQYVDSEGNQIPGVESETLEGEKGSTVTINAKDLDGWYPVVSSKNVTLTKDGLIIQMEYKQAETWKYTIKYMESNSESEQEIRKKVEKTTSSSRVVEYAPNIEGFVPDYEANKGIFKSAERPENDSQPVVITFYYKPIPKTSYTIQYQDEKGKTIFESERKEARVGEYVSVEEAQEITGYKLAKKSSSELSRSAVVKQDGSTIITIYYEKDETQWFTVTFEVDGSGGLLDDQTSYSDILTGTSWETAIQVPQTVANSGYQFDGWYENGERVEHFPTTILSDHTYKAKFKRDFSNIAVEPYEDTYDGKPHSVTVKNTISDEDKILYSTDGIQFLEDEISYTNVRTDNDGKYNVWVKVVNGNVESKAIESYIKIKPKDVTVTANNAEKLFGHEDPTFSATVTGTLNQDKIQYEVSRPGVGKDEAVGTYEDALVATGDEIQGNYKVAYVAGDFEIKTNAEDLKLTAQSGGGVYNASPYYLNNVGATLKGEALKDADIEYKVGDGKWSKDVPSATNVADSLKEISVRVTLEGYQTQQIDDLEITVTHKDVTVTANNAEKLFGHEDPTFSATVTGTLNQDKIQYEVSRPGVGKDEAVGTYEDALVATGDEIQGNYKVAYVAGDFEIKTNAEDLKFAEAETTGYNGVYDGAAHDAVTSVKVTGVNGEEIAAEDMTVEYRLSDEADWGKTPQVTDVADSTAVQIRVTVANYDPITTTVQATVTQKPVTITTESASKTYDASALTAPGEVEGIVEGETYGFEITGSQTLVGTSENSYVMTWAGEGNEYSAKSDNYTVTERVGTLTVTDGSEEEPINPEDVVKKTHGTPEGGVYKAGDVVTFTVTATNIYDEVKTITLNEIAGVTLKDTVFADVQPGETVETTATYTITEADVLAGEFVNTVTASFSGEEDTPFEDDDQVDEIEEPKGHLTIDKVTTSEPANGSSYALGETITYKITATNDGNLTLTNVKVVDELTGDEWEIASLAPGASEEFDTSYTVTEADILAGSVVNTATAEGTSPDPDKPDVPVNPGEEEEPTETEKPSLFVEKTAQPDEDGVYNLGDEIHYVIKVTNNGNVTVNDITVKDELTGDEWQLDSLTPGESEEYHATYTVTEEDILAGSITNVATAEGTDPDEDPVDQEGEETVPTDSADSHLTIHKATTSDPGDDGAYDLGDTITYEIIAANDGNVTLNNVIVTDELTGDEWIIETLAPGASETFEAEYVVTEEDIHNGSVVNEATATAEGPEEPVITPGETEDETNPENPSLTVDKSIVEEKDEYEIGDVIEYEITVANNGNVTQNDVRVTDLLQAAGDIVITGVEGADGEIDGANVTLDSLAPGESAIIHCEYTVLKEDRGSTITNAAIEDDEGKGDGEDPVTPDVPAEVADVYDINVVHQFADGEEGEAELPDDYTIENQPVGTEREITAETVEGYTVSQASQEVTIEDSDVTITFVYYTDEIGTDPENPDTPDNVPDRYQAVVTFEAVNGTVDRSAAVVTLMRNGQPAEDGIGYLTEDQIATARANVGYAQNSLTWSPGTPTAEYKVTGDMTFTASFSAIPVIPGDGGEEPVEPTNPTTPTTPARPSTPTTPTLPVTPANPGTTVTPTLPVTPQTAAPAARVYADGVVVDDPQTATDDYDLNEVERDAGTETIDEDSTPLGNMDLEKDDDHKCCILHFILLLLALIVELIYTHDRKKRQERIFELRRELADFDETV